MVFSFLFSTADITLVQKGQTFDHVPQYQVELVSHIRKWQSTFFGHITEWGKLESVTAMENLEVKRSRSRPKGMMLIGLASRHSGIPVSEIIVSTIYSLKLNTERS